MDHLLDDEPIPRHERELTLSTGSILGIFLGLVVLCGGFFGFGYNMGRKSAPTPLTVSDLNNNDATLTANSAAKPAAGSPLDETSSAPSVVTPAPKPVRHTPPPPPVATEETATGTPETPKPAARVTPPTPAPIVRQPAPVAPAALSPSAGSSTGGTFMVQVAAVSHKEDADLLVGALRSRGYAVSARPNTTDNFIHVQVGPFHDKKEADAMRQRLLTDGYNAIVKQ